MRRNAVTTAALGITAVLLVGGLEISPAWAYFTDSHETTGGIRIAVEPRTDIEEKFDSNGKHVYIKNTSKDCPVFVRAKVYTNAPQYLDTIAGTDWSEGDEGWWYWANVLEPGEYTDELNVKVAFPTELITRIINADGSVAEFEDETFENNFNVIVVYEAVPIQLDDNGNLLDPQAADWKLAFNDNGQGGE